MNGVQPPDDHPAIGRRLCRFVRVTHRAAAAIAADERG